MPDTQRLLLAAIGNSRVRLGFWDGKDVTDARSVPNVEASPSALAKFAQRASACVTATVSPRAAESFVAALTGARPGIEIMRVGTDIPVPITHALDDASTLGVDRALNAMAAYDRAQQACAVVDIGTAVTVDFVDGEGTFQGGVIAPGLHMMLRALHEHTAALPLLEPEAPDTARGPFGRDTRHAMQLGARTAVIGLVRAAVERFAIAYDAYPQIIATGGDASLLADEEIVEHFVPDLQLLGIGLCVERALAPDDDADRDD